MIRIILIVMVALALSIMAGLRSDATSSITMFGHPCVQMSGKIAYECVYQPPNGNALYWSANESNINWDKHPNTGLDWVEASTLHIATDTNPPNNRHAFWVGIAHQGVFCTVINPGEGQHPTQCEENGRIHPMSTRQQASYNSFIATLEQAGIPACAYSMTIDTSQCDIDS